MKNGGHVTSNNWRMMTFSSSVITEMSVVTLYLWIRRGPDNTSRKRRPSALSTDANKTYMIIKSDKKINRPGPFYRLTLIEFSYNEKGPQKRMLETVVVLNDHCFVNGGASKTAIDEAVGLAEAGVDVLFLGAVGPICDQLQKARLRVICLDQQELRDMTTRPWRAIQSVWNTTAHGCMEKVLDTLAPHSTIVHLHAYTKALSTSPIRAAIEHGFPVVCTLHDFFSGCPNGGFFNYPHQSLCLKKGLSVECIISQCDKRNYVHKFLRVARSLAQIHLGRLPGSVFDYIALSEMSATILRPYLPTDAHLHFLEDPIDVEQTIPVNVTSNASVFAVGRLDIEKGVELLTDAAGRHNIAVVFVGDGPLRESLEAGDGVTVTGWMEHHDVIRALESARCLVFPSLWYETYGLVVSEAAARGIPAIVSDISAAAERVVDGVTGWHFKSGDPGDLGRCLTIIRDDKMVARAGRAAYDRYWSNPQTRPRHIHELIEIYDAVHSRNGRS
jgi:glycosyltransferase involved in cell wall biosynthesis